MKGFADSLISERTAQGLSVKEAAKKSGLKVKTIKALEEEDMLKFKNKEEALLALKAYGTALGLEEAALLFSFNRQWSDVSAAKTFMQQKHREEKSFFAGGRAARLALVLGALVVFAGAGGYYFWQANEKTRFLDLAASGQEEAETLLASSLEASASDTATSLEEEAPGTGAGELAASLDESAGKELASAEGAEGGAQEAQFVEEASEEAPEGALAENGAGEEQPASAEPSEVMVAALPRSAGTLASVFLSAFLIIFGSMLFAAATILEKVRPPFFNP